MHLLFLRIIKQNFENNKQARYKNRAKFDISKVSKVVSL